MVTLIRRVRKQQSTRSLHFEILEIREVLAISGFILEGSEWVTPPSPPEVTEDGFYSHSEPAVTRYFVNYSARAEGTANPPPPPPGQIRSTETSDFPSRSNAGTEFFLAVQGPGSVVISGRGVVSGENDGISGGFPLFSRVTAGAGGSATLGSFPDTPIGPIGAWSASIDLRAGESGAAENDDFQIIEIPAAERWIKLRDTTNVRVKSTVTATAGGPASAAAEGSWSAIFIPEGTPDLVALSAETTELDTVTYEYEIQNVDVVRSFVVGIYLSADATLDDGDMLLTSQPIAGLGTESPTVDLDGVPATAQGSHRMTVSVPGLSEADFPFFIVMIDDTDAIAETEEANNTAVGRIDSSADEFNINVTTFIPGNYVPGVAQSCSVPQNPAARNQRPVRRSVVFAGDDRGPDPAATTYRTRQLITVIADAHSDADGYKEGSEQHLVGETRAYAQDALADGRIDSGDDDGILGDCSLLHAVATASASGMHASVTRVNEFEVSVHLFGGAANPLARAFGFRAPAIDWDFTIDINTSGPVPEYTLAGKWDGFPAVEIYINDQQIYLNSPGFGPYRVSELFRLFPFVGDVPVNEFGTLGASSLSSVDPLLSDLVLSSHGADVELPDSLGQSTRQLVTFDPLAAVVSPSHEKLNDRRAGWRKLKVETRIRDALFEEWSG